MNNFGRHCKQKSYYDKGRIENHFEEGAYVMLKNYRKSKFIDDYRIGPFKIWSVLENNNYLVYNHINHSWKSYNIKDLFAHSPAGIIERIPSIKNSETIKVPDLSQEKVIDMKKSEYLNTSKNIMSEPNSPSKQLVISQESNSPIKERKFKSPDKKLGKRVKVWFDDQQRFYKGVIKEKTDESDRYVVKWDIRKNDEIELSAKNETSDKANDERWMFES